MLITSSHLEQLAASKNYTWPAKHSSILILVIVLQVFRFSPNDPSAQQAQTSV